MPNGIELKGMEGLLANLERLARGAGKAVAGPTKQEAEDILKDSQENFVPYKDGDLKKSGYVGEPEERGGVVSVAIGYTAKHAVVQHENLDFKHPGGKSAKYLEIPFNNAERGMAERLAPDVSEGIERLVK
jgi:hypothetical protein